MKKRLFLLYTSVIFAGISVFSQSAKTVNRARGQLPFGDGEKNYSSKENMVLIKGGSFVMGSPVSENWREKDEVQHTVTLDDFYISKYEVTQAEYESLMKKILLILKVLICRSKMFPGMMQ